jgi:hypothetical protein
MKQNFRTGITIVLAFASVSVAAFMYATGRASLMQALNGPFLCWAALDMWYGRKWQQFKRLSGMTLGGIYRAHRDGSVTPSALWLSRTLDAGSSLLLLAMIIVFFRSI